VPLTAADILRPLLRGRAPSAGADIQQAAGRDDQKPTMPRAWPPAVSAAAGGCVVEACPSVCRERRGLGVWHIAFHVGPRARLTPKKSQKKKM